MADFKKETNGYVAPERVYATRDGKLVRDGDVRACQLVAVKGGLIPEKLAKRLGIDKGAGIEALQRPEKSDFNFGGMQTKKEAKPEPKTVAPEAIQERSTRPETISRTR